MPAVLMAFAVLLTTVVVAEWALRVQAGREARRERDNEARSREELHLPPYAWEPFLGQVHLANYASSTCVTDEHGFRNRVPVPVPKPADEFRVFLAGGSTAAGAAAPDGETILDALQAACHATRPDVRVVNVAQSAFNSSQELAQVAVFLLDFAPDVMILVDGRNDFYFATRPDWRPHVTYRMTRFTQWYEQTRQKALRRASVVRALVDDVATVLKASSLMVALVEAARPTRAPEARASKGASDADVESRIHRAALIYVENVRRIAVLAKGSHCQLCVCLQPTLLDTQKRLSERERNMRDKLWRGDLFYEENVVAHYPLFARTVDAALTRLAAEDQIVYRNCGSVFDNVGPEVDAFLDDGHLTPKGQAILAKTLYEAIAPSLKANIEQG